MAYKPKKIPTVSLERQILHYFLTSKVVLQSKFQVSNEKWFTSDPRLDLYRLLEKNFETSRNILTQTQFEFLLNSTFAEDEVRREKIISEYSAVLKIRPDEEPSIVIQNLNEALRAEAAEELILSAYSSLESGDVEEALSKLKQGSLELRKPDEDSRIVSLWDETEDWVEEVQNRKDYPEKYAGIPTGFTKFDEKTGGLFPAELTVIFGLSGKGKSTLMKQIGVNVRKQGYNVAHFGNEEDLFQMRTKYTSVETGVKYSHWKRGIWTDYDMQIWKKYKDRQAEELEDGKLPGKLFIHNFPQQTDATVIERKLAELKAQGIKIDLVIVDYLDLMSSIKRAYNENDEGGRVTGDLKQIAINFHVPVLVCTQANTTAERQEIRERPFLTAADVFGTKRKVHSANTLVGIVNQTATVGAGERDDQDIHIHRLVICVPKNRDGGVFTFRLIVHVETGQIFEDDGTDTAGAEAEARAQQILQEASLMEREANGNENKDERTVQVELNKAIESDLENILSNIPEKQEQEKEEENKESLPSEEDREFTEEIQEEKNEFLPEKEEIPESSNQMDKERAGEIKKLLQLRKSKKKSILNALAESGEK